jgi:hypothetical protein
MSTFERLEPPEADDLGRRRSADTLDDPFSQGTSSSLDVNQEPSSAIYDRLRQKWKERRKNADIDDIFMYGAVQIAEVSDCPKINQRVEKAADQLFEHLYDYFTQSDVTSLSSPVEAVNGADDVEQDKPFRAYFQLEDSFHVALHKRFLRDVGAEDDAYHQGDKIVLFDDPDNPSVVLKRKVFSHDGIPYGIQYNAERLGDTSTQDYLLDQEAM